MTREAFNGYLLFVSVAFALIGVVNLLRDGRRWLGTSSLLFGGAAILYSKEAPIPAVAVAASLGVLCLGMQARTAPRGTAS